MNRFVPMLYVYTEPEIFLFQKLLPSSFPSHLEKKKSSPILWVGTMVPDDTDDNNTDGMIMIMICIIVWW